MTLLTGQQLAGTTTRTYSVEVPADPPGAQVPAVLVFHGGGQDAETIARRWGVAPPAPVPGPLQDYLLVFPETQPELAEQWVHRGPSDGGLPSLELEFVAELCAELTTHRYLTGSASVPEVSADPAQTYAAKYSNGGGLVWQLLNSDLSAAFRGFVAVGKALDPEKSQFYRRQLAASGSEPRPARRSAICRGPRIAATGRPSPLEEQALDHTLPFVTLTEMVARNVLAAGPAATTLIPGSTGVTEVVLQLFTGVEAYLHGTVINGEHNWPTPTTRGNPPVADHFDATQTIIEFWQDHAGLP